MKLSEVQIGADYVVGGARHSPLTLARVRALELCAPKGAKQRKVLCQVQAKGPRYYGELRDVAVGEQVLLAAKDLERGWSDELQRTVDEQQRLADARDEHERRTKAVAAAASSELSEALATPVSAWVGRDEPQGALKFRVNLSLHATPQRVAYLHDELVDRLQAYLELDETTASQTLARVRALREAGL